MIDKSSGVAIKTGLPVGENYCEFKANGRTKLVGRV